MFIVRNTKLAKMYEENKIKMISKDEYENNVIEFLRYIDRDVAVARIVGRAPKDETIFCNWDTSWWKIRDEIIQNMNDRGIVQGDKSKKIIYDKIEED